MKVTGEEFAMRTAKLVVSLVLLGSMALPSQAAEPLWCTGTIDSVLVNRTGALMVLPSFRNDWLTLCSVSREWNGIEPSVCWSWYAVAMAVKSEAKRTTVYYLHEDAIDCSTLPTYSASPPPSYVRIRD